MHNILAMDKCAHAYLSEVPKASWSRHAFSCHIKCDMLNNLAESFNAWIKEARGKPILTMVEEICRQIMTQFQQKRNKIRLTQLIICPKIQKKLKKYKSDARNCISRWQNEIEFEVDHMYDAQRIVQLDKEDMHMWGVASEWNPLLTLVLQFTCTSKDRENGWIIVTR